METSQRFGGVADVWKGKYNGREVAAKVLRVYLTSDIEGIRKVGCPQVVCVNKLTISHAEILQGGNDMEDPSSSERIAIIRRDGDRKSAPVRDGVRMDGEWECERVCEGTS